jgi:hypothetical protein
MYSPGIVDECEQSCLQQLDNYQWTFYTHQWDPDKQKIPI